MRMTALLHALQEGTESAGGNAIPLLFAEARSAKKWERIRTSPFYAEQVREVREAHDQWRGEPLPVLPFSLYKQFDTTGERKAFERVYFHRRLRLNTFAVLSLLEQDPVYPEALEDVIWAVCDEYTWCLPAHLGGASLHPNRSGEHRRTVDLFAAETAFTLCEITHLLEERLNGAVVSRVRREVRERVLEPFCALSPSYWWETTDMNWAAVCGGSVGAAAMYLIRDDRTLAPILHRVLETMRAFLDGFPEDGALSGGDRILELRLRLFCLFRFIAQAKDRRPHRPHAGPACPEHRAISAEKLSGRRPYGQLLRCPFYVPVQSRLDAFSPFRVCGCRDPGCKRSDRFA